MITLPHRLILLQACLSLCSGSALALSLTVSGSPAPADMVCPNSVAPAVIPAPAAKKSGPPQDVLEVPAREVVAEAEALPTPYAHQHIPLRPTSHAMPAAIGIWGDSHLAAGFFTDELVTSLGLKKEDIKPGFLPPTMGRAGVRLPIRKYCKSPGWRFNNAYVARGDMQQSGPGLTVLENTGDDSTLWLDFRNQDSQPALKQLTVLFREITEQPVLLEVKVDDDVAQQVVLAPGENQLQLSGMLPLSQLKLRVISGALGIEGFVPVYVAPARLKLDIFGIPGATARSWRVIDPLYLQTRLNNAGYDLVVLEYGTNEGADRNFNAESYKTALAGSLRGMKTAFPNAQCLLIGPPDRGILVKKAARSSKKTAGKKSAAALRAEMLAYANTHARIAEIQKNMAQANGCGFWDWQLAMGGPGAAYQWYFKSAPWMAKDLTHLTRTGYQESARMFATDIGMAEWLK